MPVTSKAQYRFMQGVAHGNIKSSGLTREKALEFIRATGSYKRLPKRRNKNG